MRKIKRSGSSCKTVKVAAFYVLMEITGSAKNPKSSSPKRNDVNSDNYYYILTGQYHRRISELT